MKKVFISLLTAFCNFFARKMLLNQSRRSYTRNNFNCEGYIACISVLITALSGSPSVYAQQPSIDGSAQVKMEIVSQPQDDIRVEKLERFFEAHNSPLSTHAELLVSTADAYNLPWTLVAAISGVESGFCRRIPSGSSNCWGWNNGNSSFDNLSHAVYIVSRTLRYRYFDRGLDTPEKMSRIYAPPSHTWAGKVRHFMAMIENTEFENSPPIDL